MAQINRVTFGFYAPDELREIAVCTITEPRTFDQTNAPTTNGLYDPRLGDGTYSDLAQLVGRVEAEGDAVYLGHLSQLSRCRV